VEPDILPLVRADRMSILRVLRNLVDNAIKYCGADLSEVRIEYAEIEEYHVLSVCDDGVRIPKEDCKRIFGLFARNEKARGVEGMGLGVAIVKEITEAHGGEVLVTPGRKKGITFRCFLSKAL
jgi:signal transduction histidine kinase